MFPVPSLFVWKPCDETKAGGRKPTLCVICVRLRCVCLVGAHCFTAALLCGTLSALERFLSGSGSLSICIFDVELFHGVFPSLVSFWGCLQSVFAVSPLSTVPLHMFQFIHSQICTLFLNQSSQIPRRLLGYFIIQQTHVVD